MFSYLYWVTISTLGSLIGHQIIRRQRYYRTISKKTLEICAIIFVPTYFFLMWQLKHHHLVMILTPILMVALEGGIIFVGVYLRKRQFDKLLLLFLDEILANLQSGQSLRDTLLRMDRHPEFIKSFDLREICSHFMFEKPNCNLKVLIPQAQEISRELDAIYESNVGTIKKMIALRARARMEKRFFSKRDQVLSQIKAQTLICVFLYGLAWLAVSWWRPHFLLSLASGFSYVLVIFGLLIMWRLGTTFKWKH